MKTKYIKHSYIFILLFLMSFFSYSQTVWIPDSNFKSALLNYSPIIDTNNDGEIQYLEAEVLTNLDLGYENIIGLTGIEAFTNVTTLIVNNNNIVNLDLSNNTGIIELDCSFNQINSLYLGNNPNLKELICRENQISSIDLSSAISLEVFSIYSNELTSLDLSTNINLVDVHCYLNQISSITFGYAPQLSDLDVDNNLLQSLDLSNLPGLIKLLAQHNLLTTLDISSNTILEKLFIRDNQFTEINSLLNSTTSVEILSAEDNFIESVDLSNNTSVRRLYISGNLITNFIGNDTVSLVDLENNQFTTIDLSDHYQNLYKIELSDNANLTYINFKNCNNSDFFYHNVRESYNNLDNLEAVCVDDINSPFASWIQEQNSQPIVFTENCSFVPNCTFYSVIGNTNLDINNNGCDNTDITVPNVRLDITNGSVEDSFYSDDSGEFFMSTLAGNYTITPQLENNNYFNITPSVLNINFPNDPDPFLQDFCLTANGIHNDLDILVLPIDDARPGFDTYYKLIYSNKGNTTLSGSIDFTFDDDFVSFISAMPTTDIQATGSLTWNYSNLNPFESREIDLELNLNPPTDPNFPLNSDDILTYSATIMPFATDETPDDNSMIFNHTVVNSFDPNDKTCLEGSSITPDKVGEYIHYLIRFENTGTANAINVVIDDIIDTSRFDLSSLVPIRASHDFVTRITDGNKVKFIFENIQLPFDDANNDGYVLFKIKTLPSLGLGDSISNQAAIHFDFNFPIVTNNETTTIENNLSIDEFTIYNSIKLYPNPTKSQFNIKILNSIRLDSITILDVSGKILLKFSEQETYDIGGLKSGIYFVQISTETTEIIKKIIIL